MAKQVIAGRYLCEYCKIWIADNKAQRQQHESGLRHISARENVLRHITQEKEAAQRQRDRKFQSVLDATGSGKGQTQGHVDAKEFEEWRKRRRLDAQSALFELVDRRKQELGESNPTVQVEEQQEEIDPSEVAGTIGEWVSVDPGAEIGLPEEEVSKVNDTESNRNSDEQLRVGAEDKDDHEEAENREQTSPKVAENDDVVSKKRGSSKRRKYRQRTVED